MSDQEKVRAGKLKLGTKDFERLNRPAGEEGVQAAADVRSILNDNLKVSTRFEKPIEFTQRRSRRKRDYWTVLVTGNALLVGLVVALPKNPVVLVSGISGVVLFSVGVTWVMWGVMSDD